MSNIIIIPAHLDSKRLPRKALLDKTGKSLIQHTYEQCLKSKLADAVFIATDSDEILELSDSRFVIKTGKHENGTNRVAEAARILELKNIDIIINCQLDYPEINSNLFDYLFRHAFSGISSLYFNFYSANPNDVKVVIDQTQYALWFSRYINTHNIHIGIYCFVNKVLQLISQLVPSFNSKEESLEQLTWLENGYSIKMFTTIPIYGINTQEDYDAFIERTLASRI